MKKPFSALCLLVLFSFFCPLSAQTGISPELLKKYGAQNGASSSQMDLVLKNYQKEKAIQTPEKAAPANMPEDADKAFPTAQNESLYETLIKGITVHPDSLLSEITTFGYDVFSQAKPSTFAPSDFISVPGDYPINSGDELVVLLWGRINEDYRLRVSRDGSINIPRIGPVMVAGLSYDSMRKNLLDRLGSMEGVHASVSMGELRTIGVYIVGEVVSPGYYTVGSLSSVTNALFTAGGPTRRGSLRNIQLKRNGTLISSIDFYDFLLSGSDRSGLRLQSGDVIHVPIVPAMAAIAGNVRRSGLYELKGKTLLQDLIKIAGGLSPTAWANRIQVERFVKNQFQVVLDIDSTSPESLRFEINDGDIIKIFPILIKDKNAVYLSGNIARPGKYEFKSGMQITDIIPNFESLLPETYFDYGIILRQEPPSFLSRIIPFNLKKALEEPAGSDNVALIPKDEVIVYNKDFFEPNRTVIIGGAVTKPGPYKLLENMKVRDLILQAGGLSEDASPKRGEIYRREMNGTKILTQKIEFCVECAMNDQQEDNILIQRSDRVFVRQRQGWETERSVTLQGQFVYPGTYGIFEGETLGDLIKRAGGFKEDAYLEAAVFTRQTVLALEKKQRMEFLQESETNTQKLSATLAANDKSAEAEALISRQEALRQNVISDESLGRVIVDLTSPGAYSNFALEDKDLVFIPRNMNTVAVIGEVFNPATFTFNKNNQSPFYYVEAAGGYKASADRKSVYVIKANGSVITNKMQKLSKVKLMPGDAVMVPQQTRIVEGRKIFMDSLETIVKILTTAVMTITLVVAVNNMK